ncbi:MAG: phosphatase PAP2 family protein, partial [Actinomycetia bacterium]|nr:phosphatase PAP2 family protein [Actinomycetes bacterium]
SRRGSSRRGSSQRGSSQRRTGRRWALAAAPFVWEAGIIAVLYALWQLAGSLSVMGTGDAVRRGEWLLRAERGWLPAEQDVQRLITGHPLLAQAANLYYATMHFAMLFALLLWLFARHRDRYRRARNTIALLTAGCLLLQFVPVAPPRLLPAGYGFVDTAAKYGQSVYAALSGMGADEMSAMPSVHVGWAVAVAVAVITISPSRWRWLILAHPAVTIFVVVATANHYWLDGIVAVGLLVAALLAQRATRALARRRRDHRPDRRPGRQRDHRPAHRPDRRPGPQRDDREEAQEHAPPSSPAMVNGASSR